MLVQKKREKLGKIKKNWEKYPSLKLEKNNLQKDIFIPVFPIVGTTKRKETCYIETNVLHKILKNLKYSIPKEEEIP